MPASPKQCLQQRRHAVISQSSRATVAQPGAMFRPNNLSVQTSAVSASALGTKSLLYTMNDDEHGQAPSVPTIPFELPSRSTPMSQMDTLHNKTHQYRVTLQDTFTSDKGTQSAYSRHLKNYKIWWEKDQARRVQELSSTSLSDALVPAHPICATKVALFLEHETTRAKVVSSVVSSIPLIMTCNLFISNQLETAMKVTHRVWDCLL